MEISSTTDSMSAIAAFLKTEENQNSYYRKDVNISSDPFAIADTATFSDEAQALAAQISSGDSSGASSGGTGASSGDSSDTDDQTTEIQEALNNAQQELSALLSSSVDPDVKDARVNVLQSQIASLTQQLKTATNETVALI